MADLDVPALERMARAIPGLHPSPGGAVGVVHRGEVVLRHAWGLADRERRVAFMPGTLFPICSMTKQFTTALALDMIGDLEALDRVAASRLPGLARPPTARELAANQSGLRDYWALSVLQGALPEGEFRPEDFEVILAGTRTTQFAPGEKFSYSNGNFRLLALALEEATGRGFGELLRERLFAPAGMATAVLAPETGTQPGGCVGYEANADGGWVPVRNRIHWMGDAGVVASLDDMIAWERDIDRRRDDPRAPYNRISAPQSFADGTPAAYGLGIVHGTVAGRAATFHSGGLRGFRCHRLAIPSERLSVVAMTNADAAPWTSAERVAAAALGWEAPEVPSLPGEGWEGSWIDPATGLSLVIERGTGSLLARLGGKPEIVTVLSDAEARTANLQIRRDGAGVALARPIDNLRARLSPLPPPAGEAIPEGEFVEPETVSRMVLTSFGGVPQAGFEGPLGRGGFEPMRPLGGDVWLLACRRSLDAPAPWDWTLRVTRGPGGRAEGVEVGCWLARGLRFARA